MLADGVHPFRISGLPAGEFELSLLPLDGQNYEPATLRVRPPASRIDESLLGWSKSSSSSYKWRGMVVVTMTRE